MLGALVMGLHASPPASAAEDWQDIDSTPDGIGFAIDKSSIERTGQRVRFWEKMSYASPRVRDEASGKLIGQKRVQRLMDCEARTQAVLFGAVYAADGSFLTSSAFDQPEKAMQAIPAGSIAEEELKRVCGLPRGILFGIY
jgi:hypothetical protein